MRLRTTLLAILMLAMGTLTAQAQNTIDKKGLKQGPWMRVDKNGAKIYEGTFKDGKETGTFTYYYPNGTVRIRNTYTTPGKYCKHEAYDEQGHLLATGYYDQKNRDGQWKFYNEKGNLVKEADYRMGIKQGTHIIYTSKGDTAEVTTWRDNRRNGRWWKRVGEQGYITGTYVNGGLEGRLLEYDNKGQMVRDGHYKHGDKEGSYRFFENNTMTIDETWEAGRLTDRKILLKTPENQYVSINSIAYIVPRQQKSTVWLMNGTTLKCEESTETIGERIGLDDFVSVDKDHRIQANISCIQGLTTDAEGRTILDLNPRPSFDIFPDEEGIKMVKSLQRGPEMDE